MHWRDYCVGGKVWNMDRGTGMRLRKVCPQCSTVIHARRSICECGHAFTLKREARNTASYHFGEPIALLVHKNILCICSFITD